MSRQYRSIVMLCLAAGMPLLRAAEEPLRVGMQVGVAFPVSPDLKLTTGSPGAGVGLHLELPARESLVIRPRLDAQFFSRGEQHSQTAALDQTLRTRVRTLSIGADVLVPLPGLSKSTRFGLTVQELRWQVASVNKVRGTGGSTEVSGTATWWRLAWGPVVTVRVSERFEFEARLSLSHYGQENQPAQAAAVGLLWHF